MSEAATKKNSWLQEALAFWPLILAVAATSLFGLYTVKLAREVTEVAGVIAPRYQHFLSGRPNEMGDTISGFVGSLTLIWVVASVLQQSMELRAQRREFAEMVRAQDAQVVALSAQAAIFEDEKRRRDEDQHDALAVELIEDLHRAAMDLGQNSVRKWKVLLVYTATLESKKFEISFDFDLTNDTKSDLFSFYSQVSKIYMVLSGIDSHWEGFVFDKIEIVGRPTKYGTHHQIRNYSKKILEISESCSASMRVRIRSHYVEELAKWYDHLFLDESLWSGDVTSLGQA